MSYRNLLGAIDGFFEKGEDYQIVNEALAEIENDDDRMEFAQIGLISISVEFRRPNVSADLEERFVQFCKSMVSRFGPEFFLAETEVVNGSLDNWFMTQNAIAIGVKPIYRKFREEILDAASSMTKYTKKSSAQIVLALQKAKGDVNAAARLLLSSS